MNRLYWRAHALGLVIAAGAGAVLACRDTGTAPPGAVQSARSQSAHAVASADRTGRPVQPVRPRQAPDPAARAKLHRRNPMDWVGEAHNRALDAFRDELRRPGVLSRSLCGYLLTFVTSDARVPVERAAARAALGAAARRDVARKGLAATELCGRRPARPSAGVALHTWLAAFVPSRWSLAPAAVPRRSQSGELSQAARDLYAQIESSIDVAASSYELAGYLNPVLDAAAQLSAEEHATIAATVSVAQSSYEYWEVELPNYIEAVAAEYGPCLEESQQLGYTLADAEYRCVNGGGTNEAALREPADWPGGRLDPRPRLLLTVARPGSAGRVRQNAGKGLKTIGKNDASGAFSGAWGGAFSGGVQGAVLGAIVGGAGASIVTAAGLAISAVWNREFKAQK